MTDRDPIFGRLEDEPLPTLLDRLHGLAADGVLRIEARVGQHVIYFLQGFPVAVTLPGTAELLGRVMVELGYLDEAAHKETTLAPPPPGQRYGDVLRASGKVTEEQVRLALKAQVRRKLHRLFFLAEGDFTFAYEEHGEGVEGEMPMRVHPHRALYHGVRGAWSADRLSGALFLLDGEAVKSKLSADEMTRYGLGADDGRVGELLRRGHFTVPDLVDASGLHSQPVHALVYALYITDALDIQPADSVPRLRRRAPEAEARPRANTPTPDLSGSWRMPSGNYPMPQMPGDALRPDGAPQAANDGATTGPLGLAGRPRNLSPAPSLAPGTEIDLARRQIDMKSKVVENESLYEVLSVAPDADGNAIKTAYLEAAKRFHPDRLGSLGLESMRADVEKIFRRVTEAYQTLSDDVRRAEYETKRAEGLNDHGAHAKAMQMLEAEMAFRRGEILLRKQDFAGAIRELEAAVTNSPDTGEHLAFLVWAKVSAGLLTHAQAKPQLQEATRLAPKCARAFYFLGVSLREENDVSRALNMFKIAIDLDPRLMEAEREIRLIQMRREKDKGSKTSGLLDRLRKK